MEQPLNIYTLTDTFTLLSAIQQVEEPLNFLSGKFFGETMTVNTDYVVVEYKSEGRVLAPAIINNVRGVEVNRNVSKAKFYHPLIFGPRRVIGLGDVSHRLFGETPSLYDPVPPAERAARLQAEDMSDLMRMHANRREQMAASLLQTGKLEIKAYAEDGSVAEEDNIDYGWDGLINTDWTTPTADIYGDLYAVSERIQRRAGIVPTVAICGKGVEQMLMGNDALMQYLMVPLRENMTYASWAPSWTEPEIRYIGRVMALNMEFYSYGKTYLDNNNQLVPYINDNTVIIAPQTVGRTIYAPVTIFQNGNWQQIAAPLVPKYSVDDEAQTLALTLYSRYVLAPNEVAQWCTLVVKP